MYSNYEGYKTLVEIEKTYGESVLEEKLPVDYKYFTGTRLLYFFSVFFALSHDKNYHNDYVALSRLCSGSPVDSGKFSKLSPNEIFVFCQFSRIYMMTTFVNVQNIGLKIRFCLC